MKKLACAAALVLALGTTGAQAAGVQRYQLQKNTLVMTLDYYGSVYVHTFDITVNPCDGTFTGTGSVPVGNGAYHETITGRLVGSQISLTNIYIDGQDANRVSQVEGTLPNRLVGYSTQVGTPNIEFPLGMLSVSIIPSGVSNFKNHGEYVSSQGSSTDVAHSCIGMPIEK